MQCCWEWPRGRLCQTKQPRCSRLQAFLSVCVLPLLSGSRVTGSCSPGVELEGGPGRVGTGPSPHRPPKLSWPLLYRYNPTQPPSLSEGVLGVPVPSWRKAAREPTDDALMSPVMPAPCPGWGPASPQELVSVAPPGTSPRGAAVLGPP